MAAMVIIPELLTEWASIGSFLIEIFDILPRFAQTTGMMKFFMGIDKFFAVTVAIGTGVLSIFEDVIHKRGLDPTLGEIAHTNIGDVDDWMYDPALPVPAIVHVKSHWLRKKEKAFLRVQGVTLAVTMDEAPQAVVKVGEEIVSSRVELDRDYRSDLSHSFIHGQLSFIIPGLEVPVHGDFVFVNPKNITEKDKRIFEKTHDFVSKERSRKDINHAVRLARKYHKQLEAQKEELEREFGEE